MGILHNKMHHIDRMASQKMNFAFLEFMQNVPYSEDQYQMMLDIQAHCKARHMYIVPQVPAGAPCGEIDSRANEGMWARSVPFTAPSSESAGTANALRLTPDVPPAADINGGFEKVDGKVPSKWQFLASSSGEVSWALDSTEVRPGPFFPLFYVIFNRKCLFFRAF